jgi:hypothetical protein
VDERGPSDSQLETAVCEHMWTLHRLAPGQAAVTSEGAAEVSRFCVAELIAHRRAIGDEAFEREATCVTVARSAEALMGCSIGPEQEPRELCQRAMDLAQQEIDTAPRASEDELEAFLADCRRRFSIERLTADPQKWQTQMACVRVAPTRESFVRCDDL